MASEVICGDSLEGIKLLPPRHYQVAIIDPPESPNKQSKESDEYVVWLSNCIKECARVMRPDATIYLFFKPHRSSYLLPCLLSNSSEFLRLHDVIVWDKQTRHRPRRDSYDIGHEIILMFSLSGVKPLFFKDGVFIPHDPTKVKSYLNDRRYKNKAQRKLALSRGKHLTNLMSIPALRTRTERSGNPDEKPYDLIERLILSSSRIGDWVLDPFAGSGVSAAVALNHGRHYTILDNNPLYCKMAVKKISQIEEKRLASDPDLCYYI